MGVDDFTLPHVPQASPIGSHHGTRTPRQQIQRQGTPRHDRAVWQRQHQRHVSRRVPQHVHRDAGGRAEGQPGRVHAARGHHAEHAQHHAPLPREAGGGRRRRPRRPRVADAAHHQDEGRGGLRDGRGGRGVARDHAHPLRPRLRQGAEPRARARVRRGARPLPLPRLGHGPRHDHRPAAGFPHHERLLAPIRRDARLQPQRAGARLRLDGGETPREVRR